MSSDNVFINQFYSGSTDLDTHGTAQDSFLIPGSGDPVAGVLDLDIVKGPTTTPLAEANWFRSGPIPRGAKTANIIWRFQKTTHNNAVSFTVATCALYVRCYHRSPGGVPNTAELSLNLSGHIGPYISDLNTNQVGAGYLNDGSNVFWLRSVGLNDTGARQVAIGVSQATSSAQVLGLPTADEYLWTQRLDFGGDVSSTEVFLWETWCAFGF